MKYTRYCRSLLSTPAASMELYVKGCIAGADICVVDLEDSIPPPEKGDARARVQRFFSAPSISATRSGVRINALTTADGLRDLLAIAEFVAAPAIVVIPMVEAPRDIEIVDHILNGGCPEVELFAVIETPRGVENINEIATASPRLRALIFGSADYSFAVGARLSWDSLVHARANVVNGARAAHLEVVDSPSFEVANIAELRREAALAKDLGFSGKIAIHPKQVPVINEVFSPDAKTLEWARRVVAAGEQNAQNITVVDGAMVGLPFFAASQQLINEFGASAESVYRKTLPERS
jgi:citrate lyase subunit beta/citryl-CoA lyase/(S)-citramalyl-CoA lyase